MSHRRETWGVRESNAAAGLNKEWGNFRQMKISGSKVCKALEHAL